MTRRLTDTQAFLVVCSVVFLSRLPFIHSTLGTDADVYRVALAALRLTGEGIYEPSRFPGFPVQEFVFALLLGAPAVVLNLLSAGLSGVSAGVFTLILRRARLNSAVLLGLAVAATPVVYVQSTGAMDYVWALAALLGGWLVLPGHPGVAGAFLGLATACRFTSIVFLLPFLALIRMAAPAPRTRAFLTLAGSTALTVAVFYAPAYLTFEPQPGHQIPVSTDLSTILYRATVGVWGLPGSAGVAALVVLAGLHRFRRRPPPAGHTPAEAGVLMRASIVAAGVVVLVYLLHPYEAAYLIPAVPFVIVLLAGRLGRRAQAAFCGVLLLSSFSFGVFATDRPERGTRPAFAIPVPGVPGDVMLDPLAGPVPLDLETRRARRRLLDRLFSFADSTARPAVVIAGWLAPQIRYELQNTDTRGRVRFVYALRGNALRYYADQGVDIFTLSGMNDFNRRRYGVDPAAFGGRPLTFMERP